jgi:2-methylcitrate dehydratase PrpD
MSTVEQHGARPATDRPVWTRTDGGPAPESPAATLARRLVDWYARGLPPRVLREARRCLLNATAAGIAGAQTIPTARLRDGLDAAHGTGDTPAVGLDRRMAVTAAAAATAFSVTQDDFDDAHVATIVHPGAAALAGALCASTLVDLTGRQFLSAFGLAVEVQLVAAVALSPSHYDLGWHSTATCAALGSATAVGLAVGLDAPRLALALEVAAARVVGLREAHGTLLKGFQVGRGAQNGVQAALAVRRGEVAAVPVLLGRHPAIARNLTREPDPTPVLTADPDGTWRLLELTYKPYPAGIVCNSGIEAALDVATRVDPDRIEAIRLRVHPLVADLAGNGAPTDEMQARVSLPHAVAVALLEGKAGAAQFTQAAVDSPPVRRLRSRVQVLPDPDLPRVAAILDVQTDRGSISHQVDRPRGGEGRPLTDADLEAKARGLVEAIRPGLGDELIRAVNGLAHASDPGDFLAAASPGRSAATTPGVVSWPAAATPPPATNATGPLQAAGGLETALVQFALSAEDAGPSPRLACGLNDVLAAARKVRASTAQAGTGPASAAWASAAWANAAPASTAQAGTGAATPGTATQDTATPGTARLGRLGAATPGTAAAPGAAAGLVAQTLLADAEWFPAGSRQAAALIAPVAAGVVALDGPPERELPALTAGVEIAARVADALSAADEWWDAAFAGAMVATALAGVRMLAGSADTALAALGFAATQSSLLGLPAGSPLRSVMVRWAATAGVEAALVARSGLTGPAAPLTGPRGLFALHGLLDRAVQMGGGLGERWVAEHLWIPDGSQP